MGIICNTVIDNISDNDNDNVSDNRSGNDNDNSSDDSVLQVSVNSNRKSCIYLLLSSFYIL